MKPVRTIDGKTVNETTASHVREHNTRVEEAVKRLNIRDPARVLNVKELRIALNFLSLRTLRKIA